ncbi:hypothetical protein CBM2633_B60023 [Cupriavidus taiwanensis]|uniref:Uncharacterized protein n=1 Tax=Cupriavidus taiwanensis TaxID=164546 RepID=A0A976B3D2_9BURK|nr:hypothetical protein CBM2604_B40084 [Cupriavidus taiwanensis]SOZ32393.1 hypothetical protein CBM2609_B30085 [Cupriavidus taiwanensis]SOZ47984.1 hypothetical protein CBM2610_B30083 [Cupriavidus taiwanensis]SOZ69015.1 hypothetical protein CBM2614_B60034 [Cupriavidus taiwanensis]SOZ70155.1 hypothetical protein CBM2615_B70034 [Cupriavidus taiwanensis]
MAAAVAAAHSGFTLVRGYTRVWGESPYCQGTRPP